jgi:predicted N-acetyltransferase YhbS
MIEFRKMTPQDIPAGLALCRSAGWNQLDNDWTIFLTLNPNGSRVAIDENGKVAGTVTTIDYEGRFSWIGMVLVDNAKKRQGIGTQLLHEALSILQDHETIKLDATPAGREIYLKLGFHDEYTLSRMVSAGTESLPDSKIRNTTLQDFDSIIQRDNQVFGASRKELLNWIHQKYPELSFVLNTDQEIAYSFGRKGFNFTQIGPVIANTADEAIQLTTATLKNISGPVAIDVINDSPFQQWLTSTGFTEQRKLIRMYRGTNAYPGMPHKQFAILGPEFG